MPLRLLTLCFLCLWFSLLKGQPPQLLFTPIQSINGLSENRVRNINQLLDGRMVIITEGMINLYDGTAFKKISIDEENIISIPGYRGFQQNYIEGNERLWLKNRGRLILVDLLKERFETHPKRVLATFGINMPLADFFIDQQQNLWFLTQSDKLFCYDKIQKRSKEILSSVSKLGGSADVLYDLAVRDKRLFLFYKSGLILCLDNNTKKELYREQAVEPDEAEFYSRTLLLLPHKNSFLQLRNGRRNRMQIYNIGNKTWQTLLETDYWLNSMTVDRDDNIWVSCTKGLWFIDKSLQKKIFIPSLPLADGRSISTEVSNIFIDKKGGFWAGTDNRGLLYYHPDRFKFRNIGPTHFNEFTQKELLVTSFIEDVDGTILVGTNKGLYTYNSTKPELRIYSKSLKNITSRALYKDSQHRIWIGANEGLFSLINGNVKHYPLGQISSTYQVSADILLLSTRYEGWGLFNLQTLSFKGITTTTGERLNYVLQLIKWNKQYLGICEENLFTYNPVTNKVYYPHKQQNKPPIFKHSNHQYNCLYKDSRGLLWFGTRDGLNIWNEKSQKNTSYYPSNGLAGNSVKAIIEDAAHNMWVTTSNGISKFTVTTPAKNLQFAITNYNKYDGLIDDEFLERSIFISKQNQLLAGGIGGFNEISTARTAKTTSTFNPVFTVFHLNGKPVREGVAYNNNIVLENSIANTKELNLNHNQNFFNISFSALNYVNPTQTYYQYTLEGVDKTWHETVSANGLGQATYTNLEPGNYIFKVKAASSDKDWRGKTAVLKITIDAPFWNTTFARLLYLIFSTGLIYFLVSAYLKKNKQRLLIKQKERLDEAKFNFFTNLSHELRTPLTLIISPLEALLKKPDQGELKGKLQGIHRNALNLLDLVSQLLDFRRLELDGEKLHLSYCNISEYVRVLSQAFEQLAADRNITLNISNDVDELYCYIDKDKFSKTINNLLSNAFKFTASAGRIAVHLKTVKSLNEDDDAVTIEVSDTGAGIAEEEQQLIFDRFQQANNHSEGTGTGIGLYLVKQYTELHNGWVKVESKLGEGSKFVVNIPLNLQPDIAKTDKLGTLISPEAGGEKLKLLVVEDNEEFRDFLANQLAETYSIVTAVNGKEGLDKALTESPDLIITDLMMPVMSGLELCSALKADIRISHTPIILLTARSSEDVKFEGYEVGADAFISKPFNIDLLLLRIRKLIEQQEQRKSMFKNSIVVQPASITSTTLDEKLIKRVLDCVEKNMDNSSYSVEQLSSDMNMDRTGLYRKLVAVTGQTPSIFIRSVRLKKAAQLLLEKEFNITEISGKVGFSNVAYFSKCFQEEFGLKPSLYAKDSTI